MGRRSMFTKQILIVSVRVKADFKRVLCAFRKILTTRRYQHPMIFALVGFSLIVLYQNASNQVPEEDSVMDYLMPTLVAYAEFSGNSCQVTISACPNRPSLVGTFVEPDLITQQDQSTCLAKADYYTGLCGNRSDSSRIAIARFLNGATVLGTRTVGTTCEVTLAACPRNSQRVGTFEISENGAARSASACADQAATIYRSCGLEPKSGLSVTTRFSQDGSVVSSKVFGQYLCVIDQNYCPNFPREVGVFIDPEMSAHASATACLARATHYQNRCGRNITTRVSYLNNGALTHSRQVSAPLDPGVIKNFSAARSNDQLWPASNALNGAVYSSNPFTSTRNDRDSYLELNFSESTGLVAINTIVLTARRDEDGRSLYFPQSYEIAVKAENGASWITIPQVFSDQPDANGLARVFLGQTFNTRAVRVKPIAVASDSVFGGYYFQVAKVQALYQKPHDHKFKTVFASEELWPSSSLIDSNAESIYSSNAFSSSVNDRGFHIAAWFDPEMGNARVNTVILTPRIYRGASFQFPRSYKISVASEDGSHWITLSGVYTKQPDQSGVAIVGLDRTYLTSGIAITPVTLGGSPTDGFFFQLGEMTATYLTPVAPAFELATNQPITVGGFTLLYKLDGNLLLYSRFGQTNQSVVWQSRTSKDCATGCVVQFGTYSSNFILSKNGQPYAFGKFLDGDALPVESGTISRQISRAVASLTSDSTNASPSTSTCTVPSATRTYFRGAVDYLNGAKSAPNVTQAAEQCLATIQDAIASMEYLGWPCGAVANAYNQYVQECVTLVQGGVSQAVTRAQQVQAAAQAAAAEQAQEAAMAAEMARIKAVSQDGRFGPFELQPGEYVVAGTLSLEFQTDGQLVLFNLRSIGKEILWASGTIRSSCSSNCRAKFQDDGNLIISQNGSRYFDTGNPGQSGVKLVVLPQAPFVAVLRANNFILWAPGSVPEALRTSLIEMHRYNGEQARYWTSYEAVAGNCTKQMIMSRCSLDWNREIDIVRNVGWSYRDTYRLLEREQRCYDTFRPENSDKLYACQPF